jgi:general secretion pathway protein D
MCFALLSFAQVATRFSLQCRSNSLHAATPLFVTRYVRLLVSVVALLTAGWLAAADRSAWELYEDGRDAEKAGRMVEAYILYSQAAAKEPNNQTYWFRSQSVKSRAALQASVLPKVPTPSDLDREFDEDSQKPIEAATPEDLVQARQPLPPSHLSVDEGRQDFDVRGTYKEVFESVAKSWGLDCVFDSDYQPGPQFRFKLQNVDYRDALHGLEAATGSFIIPISDKLFLVAKDTPQKRTEIEPTVTVAIPITEGYQQQDFQEMVRYVQQTMALEKVAWDSSSNTVVLRDRISKVFPARALFQDLMRPRAQVVIEMQFLQVSRNDLVTYGLDLPTLLSFNPLTTAFHNLASLPTSASGLLTFGGGKTLIGIGIASAAAVAQMSLSSGKLLLDTQLRALSNQKATLHVGERYPILTGSYGVPIAGGYVQPPAFNFEDLGLNLTVTPLVHDAKEVSLDLEANYKVLTGQSLNDIPVIANRSIKQDVRLKFDEWAVVSGLLESDEARTIAGLAGISRIPVLAELTSKRTHQTSTDEVLVLLRPVLVTLPPNEALVHTIRTGSESRPISPL